MDNNLFSYLKNHILAILLFFVVSTIYFFPVFQGEKIASHDIKAYKGSAKEIVDYREETGKEALWTNRLFGGMPAYLISFSNKSNLLAFVHKFIQFDQKIRPINYIFIALVSFYFLLYLFGVHPYLCIAGAFAYGFSTYFFIIIGAGHATKMQALAYLPLVIGGVLYAYNKNALIGSLVFGIFLSFQILQNHVQITYYTLLILLIYFIVKIKQVLESKEYKSFFKTSGLLLIALILAVGSNSTTLLLVKQYHPYSQRGPSELESNKEDQTSGLDKSYILNDYSFSKSESLTHIRPNAVGGVTGDRPDKDSELYDVIRNIGNPQLAKFLTQAPLLNYWGGQRFTAGPVYIGAIVFFLFILGIFLIKGPMKWWLVIATLIAILLSWGKYFMFLSDLFINYFPMYNKFRVPSMILVIAEFAMPLLAILTVHKIAIGKIDKKTFVNGFKKSLMIVGGIFLILVLFPKMILSFEAQYVVEGIDTTYDNYVRQILEKNQLPNTLIDKIFTALQNDRAKLLKTDAIRSLFFVGITALFIWLWQTDKLKDKMFYIILAVLFFLDLGVINWRYLDHEKFDDAELEEVPFSPSFADIQILKDTSNYRVLNLTSSDGTFNDAGTSYFHNSVGGYSAVKMRRYQELISYHISKEMEVFKSALEIGNDSIIHNTLENLSVLNMLNTKYIISHPDASPISNTSNLGNAWFIESYQIVDNADEEIQALHKIDPSKTAVIDKRFEDLIVGYDTNDFDSSASIRLTDYEPNYLIYKSDLTKEQLAVFSEIYYEKGWDMYVNGEPRPHFRVNYVLRGAIIPKGENLIEFKFEPKTYTIGSVISLVSSLIIIIIMIGSVAYYIINRKINNLGIKE